MDKKKFNERRQFNIGGYAINHEITQWLKIIEMKSGWVMTKVMLLIISHKLSYRYKKFHVGRISITLFASATDAIVILNV